MGVTPYFQHTISGVEQCLHLVQDQTRASRDRHADEAGSEFVHLPQPRTALHHGLLFWWFAVNNSVVNRTDLLAQGCRRSQLYPFVQFLPSFVLSPLLDPRFHRLVDEREYQSLGLGDSKSSEPCQYNHAVLGQPLLGLGRRRVRH